MKNFFKGLLRAVFVAFIPAVFVAILLIALKQSFAIGLTMILTSLIIQFILSFKFESEFSWTEYTKFHLIGILPNEKFSRKLNILSNLVKVLSVLGLLHLVYLNFSEEFNPFGGLGMVITISLALICILFVLFKERIKDYEAVRGCLAVIIGFAILSFAYLLFGTQLIWIPLILAVVFGIFFAGFDEIDNIIKKEGAVITFLISVLLLLTAIVSTIIQFWSPIVNFFVSIRDFIIMVLTYELISSIPVWVILLSAGFIAAFIFSARYAGKKKMEKIERSKLQKQNEERLAGEKRFKEEQKAANKEIADKKQRTIEEFSVKAKDESLDRDMITYLSDFVCEFGFGFLSKFSVDSLINIDLEKFFTISEIKKQIVWDPEFNNLLKMYGALYARTYQDDDLKKITAIFQKLADNLQYNQFVGYKVIKELIEETKIPVNW